jgi:hypothetical protein
MNAALEFETIDLSVISARGGFDINWRKVGEYVAPLVPFGAGASLMNKGAAAQGAVWAAGGALAGSPGGPAGMALGATGGGLAGYYGALLSRDIPTT